MSIETHRVVIGAAGWKHPAWVNEFYSEDLPADWQLGFYSNEFSVVYVPAADWLYASDMAEWAEGVSDTFRFILEIPAHILSDTAAFTAALNQAKEINEFCLGLVFQLTQNICGDSQLIQKCLAEAKSIAPVCIDLKAGVVSDALNSILANNHITTVWNGEMQNTETAKDPGLTGGRLALSIITTEHMDMRGLRKVLERCLSVSTEECMSVLIFKGEPPSLDMMRNADTLLNLL
jgi:hypothetical protein